MTNEPSSRYTKLYVGAAFAAGAAYGAVWSFGNQAGALTGAVFGGVIFAIAFLCARGVPARHGTAGVVTRAAVGVVVIGLGLVMLRVWLA